jgi:hypothetical protein
LKKKLKRISLPQTKETSTRFDKRMKIVNSVYWSPIEIEIGNNFCILKNEKILKGRKIKFEKDKIQRESFSLKKIEPSTFWRREQYLQFEF